MKEDLGWKSKEVEEVEDTKYREERRIGVKSHRGVEKRKEMEEEGSDFSSLNVKVELKRVLTLIFHLDLLLPCILKILRYKQLTVWTFP